jgi:hypothetical protein
MELHLESPPPDRLVVKMGSSGRRGTNGAGIAYREIRETVQARLPNLRQTAALSCEFVRQGIGWLSLCHAIPGVLIILFSAVAERRATFVHQGDVVGCDPQLEGST